MNTPTATTPTTPTKKTISLFSKLSGWRSPSDRKLKSRAAEVQFVQARQMGGMVSTASAGSPTNSPRPSPKATGRRDVMDVMQETSDIAEWFHELQKVEQERQRLAAHRTTSTMTLNHQDRTAASRRTNHHESM